MSPVTHFLTGWVVACSARLDQRERIAVTVAAVIPDLDGIGILPELLTRHSSHPLLWFSQYHHALHNLLFGLVVALLVFALSTRRWLTAALALGAFHLHLLEDLVGSRGPDGFDWPIPYLEPFTSRWQWSWSGQWQLNAWPNLALTVALLALTIWLAATRGLSPVSLFSPKADSGVVTVLRRRVARMDGLAFMQIPVTITEQSLKAQKEQADEANCPGTDGGDVHGRNGGNSRGNAS